MTRFILPLLAVLMAGAPAAAHNHPVFAMRVIADIEAQPEAAPDGANSAAFRLEFDRDTILFHYEIEPPEARGARFSIAAGGAVVAADLGHGSQSRVLRQESFRIVSVTGAGRPFRIAVIAEEPVK